MQRGQQYLWCGVILILFLSGCAPGVKQKPLTVEKTYENGILDLTRSLEHAITTAGKETVAILDFSDAEKNLTDLSLVMTDDIASALANTEKELWVVSGPYLRELINRSKFTMSDLRENPEIASKFWQIMGIETVMTGMVSVQDEDTLQLATRIFNMDVEEEDAVSQQLLGEYTQTMLAKNVVRQPPLRSARAAMPIPEFPWPPPQPSASVKVPSEFLLNSETSTLLQEVAERLERAFEQAGYGEYSYYQVPDGFALISQIEQYNPDGTPKELPDRWAAALTPPRSFSLTAYVKSLFTSQAGYYRIIAFIVTSAPFAQTTNIVTPQEAEAWVTGGSRQLPANIGELGYTDHHYCTALIYEFEQTDQNSAPMFKELSELSGKEHLKKATLWSVLFSLRAILQF
ncbi:hypothetical protein U27_02825 [Candidatus Vecturithrix granuli]|uniref:Uncharacterized protein n=1 Tax=Vecturithrix granuli TaxID=1499967 RepID=A0A081BU59_VECG1|nr:hypothetical protein U27_02825 [Candidatus Vecturithrix granuli]